MNSIFDNLQIKGFCPNPTVEGDIKDLFNSMNNDQKQSVYRYATELINNNIRIQELITMKYVDYVYDIVRLDCEGMDSIYKDYIIQMVGFYGFNALREAVES